MTPSLRHLSFRPARLLASSELRRRLRLPLLGLLLMVSVAWLVRDRLDARLAAEASRQAEEGRSLAVAVVRADWAASVIPTALAGNGIAGEDARRVAQVRLDLAIGRARRGDTAPLEELAAATLGAIYELNEVATDAGAEWAEWLTPRLIEAAETLEPEQRVALIRSADRTLDRLAVRPRRRELVADTETKPLIEPEPTPVEASEPATESIAESIEVPDPPLSARAVEEPEPLAARWVVVPPKPPAERREPGDWSPDWRVESAAPNAPPTDATPDPGSSERDADLRLLEELVALARQLPDTTEGPYARGPKSLPGPTDRLAELRRERLAAVRSQLAARGYQSVTRDQVAALLSDDDGDRLRLAERLPMGRSGDSARLLLLLAEDPSAAVREAAVSALGSSSNRGLVEAAYAIAVKDRDPRVGRLAQPLRERLR